MFDAERKSIEEQIQEYCQENQIPLGDQIPWTRIPFSGEWGISTSFFQVAANEARAGKKVVVPQRAQEIAAAIAQELGTPDGFSRVEALKGYLNCYFSAAQYSRRVVDAAIDLGADFGRGASTGVRSMVEYSQPNTHKPLHVGHLRNMILGAAICNILEFSGQEVVRTNYPGDTGLHVIKWMWNYQKNHAGEQPPEDKTRWMGDLYAEANQLLEENPDLEPEMRAMFARWEQNDPEIKALWQKTRQWSQEGFDNIYDKLGIRFDRYYYQSEVDAAGKAVVDDLIARGIAIDERPEGPVIVRIDDILGLEKEQYRVMVALRSDGTALYSTWDLALAARKFADYELDHSIYVIDVRQSLHFQQVFKTLEIMGYEWTDRLYHLPYEIVNLPGNVTMKSREGTVVLLEDLLREATKRALEIVEEKNPELEEETKTAVAEAVALGAIKYPLLARDNTKIATFDWDSALDFNGQAAPYIQYAHVRANSILRRLEAPLPESQIPNHTLEPAEIELIELISRFPEEVQRAAKEFKTLHITNLAYELARGFNDFYNQCPVLKAEAEVRAARLRLVAAARQAMANALAMLGITAPDVM
ncbi:MAG: arginine--tRNA ligase [Anaerolineae bacterium]|nr:arginine--tRNA ligase [Anaerolineae bacterium]